MIEADHEQLRQLFLNLLVNALDTLPQGGDIRVAVSSADAAAAPGPPGLVRRLAGTTGVGRGDRRAEVGRRHGRR